MSRKIYSGNGKLLLFGEYAVLDGAKALAIPCRYGQTLEIKPHRGSDLIWEAYDKDGNLWFEAQISLYDFSSVRTSDQATSEFLQKVLKGAVRYNTEFLNKWNGFKAITRLQFPREWGLGSSSSLIYNVANWADVNPFHLHFYVSSGSGYDIACAGAGAPLLYQLKDDELNYEEIDFHPDFLDKLFFVYQGRKQCSEEGIMLYSKTAKRRKDIAKKVSEITESVMQVSSLESFSELMTEHEKVIAQALNCPTIQEEKFADFPGTIKSLGAWGGDFILAASKEPAGKVQKYFEEKGLSTVLPYQELIFHD